LAQLAIRNNLFAEDITIGGSVTYVAGGITITVANASAIATVHAAQLKGPSGTSSGTQIVVSPVFGSESGQTFKLKAYEAPTGTVGGLLAELAPSSTALQGLTLAVVYSGV
jgi:hypothetical protein